MIKKIILSIGIVVLLIWLGFWFYKQYRLSDFNIDDAAKTGRIISIRGQLYNVHFVNNYPILLMSDDAGKTWYEKNIRGVWNVFPLPEFIQLDSPIVDVISIDNVIYIMSRSKYGDWESSSGFFFRYKSTDEGRSWSDCLTFDTQFFGRTILAQEPYEYSTYDNKTETEHWFTQDDAIVIQAK